MMGLVNSADVEMDEDELAAGRIRLGCQPQASLQISMPAMQLQLSCHPTCSSPAGSARNTIGDTEGISQDHFLHADNQCIQFTAVRKVRITLGPIFHPPRRIRGSKPDVGLEHGKRCVTPFQFCITWPKQPHERSFLSLLSFSNPSIIGDCPATGTLRLCTHHV